MGAAYAFFLPFIGFAMVAVYLMKRVRGEVTTTTPPAIDAAGHTHGHGVTGTTRAADVPEHRKAA